MDNLAALIKLIGMTETHRLDVVISGRKQIQMHITKKVRGEFKDIVVMHSSNLEFTTVDEMAGEFIQKLAAQALEIKEHV